MTSLDFRDAGSMRKNAAPLAKIRLNLIALSLKIPMMQFRPAAWFNRAFAYLVVQIRWTGDSPSPARDRKNDILYGKPQLKPWYSCSLILTVGFFGFATAQAAQDVGLERNRTVRTFHIVEVSVVDENGHPLAGARVSPRVLVSKNGAHDWDEERWGAIPTGESDREGKARIQIPGSALQQPIRTVHWSVTHEDHVALTFNSGADQRTLTCQLKRGRRIAVSAIDSQAGQRLQSHTFVVLSGHTVVDHWNQMNSGILVSDGLAINRQMLRVIHLPPGKPACYSAAIDLSTYGDQPRIFLHDVEVYPGIRLEGRLDDRVPRPVHGGIISAFVVNGRNEWYDMAVVNDDGTFAIDSLPRGDIVQLTALCVDWVSSDPTVKELAAADMEEQASRLQRSRVYPQVVRLEADVVRSVIRMESATTCHVQVIETDGTPIRGARVRLMPYQGSFDGRSHIFGYGENTKVRLLSGASSITTQRCVELGIARDVKSRFTAFTGDNGVAEITSLPGGPDGSPAMTSFVVTHPDYFAANSGGLGDQGSSRVALYSGQIANVIVRMKRK